MIERTTNTTKRYRGQFCYVIKILFQQSILTPRFADVILVWAETIKMFSFYLTCIVGAPLLGLAKSIYYTLLHKVLELSGYTK